MKNKILFISLLMFAFVFAFNSYALAQGNNAENGAQQNQQQEQTFEIILPNLIHKSKKRNLKKI